MSLKEQMLAYFQLPEINNKIVDYLGRKGWDVEELDEQHLAVMLEDLQLMDEMQRLGRVEDKNGQQSLQQTNLTMTITRGRKFKSLAQLGAGHTFFLTLSGFRQKAKSSVYEVAENFTLLEKLSLPLSSSELKIDNSNSLELILVAVSPSSHKLLYSIKLVQWRFLMVYGSMSIDIQLAPYETDGGNLTSVGILSISMQLSPLPKHCVTSQITLNRQLEMQQKLKESSNNKFYSYANTFWNEIKSVHRSLQTRRVPIYAQTEDKVYYALPKMIKALYGVRGIDSPHHALRFCSLIPFCELPLNRERYYRRFSSMLSSQSGTVEDHCHLLCSLLLGFGIKAYVCVGGISKGQHSWVMSQTKDSITFWQCTKGLKLDFFSPKSLTFYKTINAVYNNKEYYANLQLDDSISGTKFNFKDGTLWKKMDESILEGLNQYNKFLSLSFPSINPYQTQQNIEKSLAKLVQQHRNKQKLSYSYDSTLSSLLATALSNYEVQRVTGNTFCEQQFALAIKNYIPNKHTFKAFPIQLTTLDPKEIMLQLQDQPKAKEILNIRGQSLCFAIRCKLVVFPDNIFALWVSLAVRYYLLD